MHQTRAHVHLDISRENALEMHHEMSRMSGVLGCPSGFREPNSTRQDSNRNGTDLCLYHQSTRDPKEAQHTLKKTLAKWKKKPFIKQMLNVSEPERMGKFSSCSAFCEQGNLLRSESHMLCSSARFKAQFNFVFPDNERYTPCIQTVQHTVYICLIIFVLCVCHASY